MLHRVASKAGGITGSALAKKGLSAGDHHIRRLQVPIPRRVKKHVASDAWSWAITAHTMYRTAVERGNTRSLTRAVQAKGLALEDDLLRVNPQNGVGTKVPSDRLCLEIPTPGRQGFINAAHSIRAPGKPAFASRVARAHPPSARGLDGGFDQPAATDTNMN